MRRRLVFTWAAALAVGISTAVPVAASDQTALAPSQSITFRQEFGLRSDAGFVASVEASPLADRTYGVALTDTEVRDLSSRDAITQALGPMMEKLEASPAFGGLYVDQAAGGVIDIAATSSEDALDEIISSYAPPGAIVRTRRVEYSRSALEALQASISSDYERWQKKGAVLASVGVDVKANRVDVTVAGDSSQDMLDEIAAWYGPAVTVAPGELAVASTCVDRTNCGSPLKGGLRITAPGWGCTSAMLVRASTNPPFQLYGMTAGHCIRDAGISAVWSHHGVTIGQGAYNGFFNGSHADVGLFWASTQGTPRNLAFASSNLDIRNITGGLSNSQQPVGAQICKSGATTGWQCGQVSATNVDETFAGGIRIIGMWVTNFGNDSGDSGAIMMNNGPMFGGVLSGSINNKTQTIYSTLDNIKVILSITPCYTSACS